jgi:Fe-S oxidoreductase
VEDFRQLSPKERVELIERQGSSLPVADLRRKILGSFFSCPMDKPAQYTLISGCHNAFNITHLKRFTDILKYYHVSFTFLAREMCCGHSFLEKLGKGTGDSERREYETLARKYEGSNIDVAKKLGSQALIVACAGCYVQYHDLGMGDDFKIYYYAQFLDTILDGLNSVRKIDFYEGCHKMHRVENFRMDVETPKRIMSKISGLQYDEIPNYCCRASKGAAKVLNASTSGTIVTPTTCCFSFLNQGRQEGDAEVICLTDFIATSLGI